MAVEQPPQRERVEHPSCGGGSKRCQCGAPVGEHLDQHAARAYHHDRTELRIADHAQRDLDPRRQHLRDERVRAQPRREVLPRVAHRGLVSEIEMDAACVGLVQDAGLRGLQHDWVAQLCGGAESFDLAVDDPMRDDRNAVVCKQREPTSFIERASRNALRCPCLPLHRALGQDLRRRIVGPRAELS